MMEEMRETRVESIAVDVPEVKVGNTITAYVSSVC